MPRLIRLADREWPHGGENVFCKDDAGIWFMGWYQSGYWMEGSTECQRKVVWWVSPESLSEPDSMSLVASDIMLWHHDRNLINGSDDKTQFVKLVEETGELAGEIARGRNDVRDHIGDMIVVLINIAGRHGHSLLDCMVTAWEDIKDRRGMMVDGVFVKEDDLPDALQEASRKFTSGDLVDSGASRED